MFWCQEFVITSNNAKPTRHGTFRHARAHYSYYKHTHIHLRILCDERSFLWVILWDRTSNLNINCSNESNAGHVFLGNQQINGHIWMCMYICSEVHNYNIEYMFSS